MDLNPRISNAKNNYPKRSRLTDVLVPFQRYAASESVNRVNDIIDCEMFLPQIDNIK